MDVTSGFSYGLVTESEVEVEEYAVKSIGAGTKGTEIKLRAGKPMISLDVCFGFVSLVRVAVLTVDEVNISSSSKDVDNSRSKGVSGEKDIIVSSSDSMLSSGESAASMYT